MTVFSRRQSLSELRDYITRGTGRTNALQAGRGRSMHECPGTRPEPEPHSQ